MVKSKLMELCVPSPLCVNGKKAQSVPEWEALRPAVKEIMQKHEYGYLPEAPESVDFELVEDDEVRGWGGKAHCYKLKIKSVIKGEEFVFPAYYMYPLKGSDFKTVVHINFRPNVPDRYQPNEEIIDNGFACLSFCYNDITSDDADFTDGLAGILYKNTQRTLYSPGKIAMWAWAAMRAMDFLQTREEVNKDAICVAGHSRLGKTALLTAALDERFAFAHSNCAGCSGDALNRGKQEGNEVIGHICDRFWYWFCENYKNYIGKDEKTPFDQNYLHALIAPRKVHIASAKEDIWAAPNLQFLCCVAANEVFELYGLKGLVYTDSDFLNSDKFLNDGNIGFCYREGKHFFSRDDWHGLMDFMNKHS